MPDLGQSATIADVFWSGLGGAILGAIVGAIAGAWFAHYLQQGREKIAFTMNLLADWGSADMYRTRTRAWGLIKDHPNARFDTDIVYVDDRSNDMGAVIGFFKMMDYLVQNNLVDKDAVADGIGQAFTWWYYASFDRQLMPIGEQWDLTASIANLEKWLNGYFEERRAPWIERAIREARAAGAVIPPESPAA